MLSAHGLTFAVTALMTLLLVSVSPSFAATITTTFLNLQLFNDSACTVAAPVAVFSQPVPVQGISTCVTAPPSLTAATGLASYAVGCGISPYTIFNLSTNVSTTISEPFALGSLWYGSPSSDAATCPNTASQTAVRTAFNVYDYNPEHSAASCVGPFSVRSYVNYTVLVSSMSVYAQWACNVTTTSNAAAANRQSAISSYGMATLLLLMLPVVLQMTA